VLALVKQMKNKRKPWKSRYDNKNRYPNQFTTQNKISPYRQYKLKSIKIYTLLNKFKTTQQAQNYW